jgi:hypothetical protein
MKMHAKTRTLLEDSTVPRPPSDTVQVAIRIPREWLAKADELAKRISRPGVTMSRTDALRAAIAAGFTVLEGEGEAAPAGKAPARKAKKR